jgi:8-oxo-dGTP diphosphatase
MTSPQTQVVAGVLRRSRKILLCHRRADRSHYPEVWDLPGGRVEPGETLVETLRRELAEELGIIARPSQTTPWVTLTDDTLQLHIFVIDDWTGKPANNAPDEHDEIRWVSRDEWGDLILADNAYVDLFNRVLAPSEHGHRDSQGRPG